MTAQLSRIVYRIGNPENDQHHFTDQKDHADIAKKNGYEVAEYVLAGMDSEPVAVIDKEGNPMTRAECNDDRVFAICCKVGTPLYAAPPAPVAVPDDESESEMKWRDLALQFDGHRMQSLCFLKYILSQLPETEFVEAREFLKSGPLPGEEVLRNRITAILNAGPVTSAAVPDGWKLVPVEPTAEMYDAGDMQLATKQVWDAMLAVAPAAPEQEV